MKQVKYLVVILFSILVLSACTQQRLKKEGNSLHIEGRYEEAVQRFRSALSRKPDDEEARLGLMAAERDLNLWLARVRSAADQAFEQKQAGKALLLYGKIHQLNSNTHVSSRYRLLRNQIKDNNEIRIHLSYPKDIFGRDLGAKSDAFILSDRRLTTKNNQWNISLSRSSLNVDRKHESVTETKQYQSGYENIPNPEYHQLANEITELKKQVSRQRSQLSQAGSDELLLQRDIKSADKDLQIARLTLDGGSSDNANYSHLQNQYNSALNHLNALNDKKNALISRQNSLKNSISRKRKDIDHKNQHLKSLEQYTQKELYSDYRYTRHIEKQIVSGQLLATINGTTQKTYIEFVDQDDAHPAHPTIQLDAKEARLLSYGELEQRFNQKLRRETLKLLDSLCYEQKQSSALLANKLVTNDDKLDRWMDYAFVGVDGVSPDIERQIRSILHGEFGYGGVFDVNRLISLF